MLYIVLTVHIILCLALIGLVLLQQGKGAEMGATLGGGSNTLFGAGGATGLVIKTTTLIAIAFMGTSIMLIRIYQNQSSRPGIVGDPTAGSLMEAEQAAPASPAAPSTDAPAAAPAPAANKTENSDVGAVDKKGEESQSSNASTVTPNTAAPEGVVAEGTAAKEAASEASPAKAGEPTEATTEAVNPAEGPEAKQ